MDDVGPRLGPNGIDIVPDGGINPWQVDGQSITKPVVIAVHGKWGSGKSSLLNFIKHDLKKLPDARRPVMVDFNPWWFDDPDPGRWTEHG